LLSLIFGHLAITIAAGMVVLIFGAKMLRTLIFNEALYLADILQIGRHFVKK